MSRSAPFPTTALAGFRRGGGLARLAALAGVLAVLLQGALPIAHQARMATSDRLYADYLIAFGEAANHALCGFDTAASGDDWPAKPVPSDHPPSCPLCLAALQASSFLPPVGMAAPMPAQHSTVVTTIRVAAARPLAIASEARARAPPQPT